MAKRKRKFGEAELKRKIKEGRGQGELGNYKPWLYVQDVPSKGLSTRIKGIKTGRVHHLLSLLELYLFYLLDWSESVVDIQEQYPLFLEETLVIGERLNIKHPAVRVPSVKVRSGSELIAKFNYVPVIMTTDFRVTVRKKPFGNSVVAISAKYSKDLNKPRTIKKFEIERVYWERRKVEWKIFTERDVNKTLIKNIEWVHSFDNPDWLLCGIESELLQEVTGFLFNLLSVNRMPLRTATDLSDRKFNFAPGVSLLIVRHSIASRKWNIDMTIPIVPLNPLVFINRQ